MIWNRKPATFLFSKSCLLSVAVVASMPAAAGKAIAAPELPSLSSTNADGFNLKSIRSSATQIDVTPAVKGRAHNWFAGTVTNLPTTRETTIRVSMQGHDIKGSRAWVGNWLGLQPVLTYADPGRSESYSTYLKDAAGNWQCTDPLLNEQQRNAGNGELPRQEVVPAAFARQFLSADGKKWSAWKDLETVEALPQENIFAIRHRFDMTSATVAMRVPYTVKYRDQFLERLKQANLPGVFIDEIATTAEGAKLQMVRLEPPGGASGGEVVTEKSRDTPTVVVIAREHATEHASSWPLHGLIQSLIADVPKARELRQGATWMVLLIEDPVGAGDNVFARMTDAFRDPHSSKTPPEVFDYARYFVDYVDKNRRTIDVAVSLHNVESDGGRHIFSPFANWRQYKLTEEFNRLLFTDMRTAGYRTGKDNSEMHGAVPTRLYGWLAARFGTLDLAYEVNDRYPEQRLDLDRLQGLGGVMAGSIGAWCQSEAGREWHRALLSGLDKRREASAAYYREYGPAREGLSRSLQRARYDLLTKGYIFRPSDAIPAGTAP